MNTASQKSARLEADDDDPLLGCSLVYGWNRDAAQAESVRRGCADPPRPISHSVGNALVESSGGRLIGFPGPARGKANLTKCSLRWNVSRPTDLVGANTFSIVFNFPMVSNDSETTSNAPFVVKFLFEAPDYDIIYQGPMHKDAFPPGLKAAAGGRDLSLFRILPTNGTKPLILGFPSEGTSVVAKFWVPILERQDQFLVAVDDRAIGRLKQWCRNAALGYY